MSLSALTQAVLLGTGRRPVPDVELPGDVAALAAAGTAERRLLRSAAVGAVMRRAGERPERVQRLPDAAADEPRPACSARAADDLSAILHGPFDPALLEWLRALRPTGRTLPPELLPALLDRVTGDAALALAAEPVLPERARWLAAQHEDWDWAVGGDVHERWQTGSRAARLHLLRTLRAEDPAMGRALLSATWDQESGRDREAFLAELATGLRPDDEPFLEAALEDRRQTVRAQAAGLLSALPGSALAARMAARLEPLIDTRLRKLVVELPAGIDDDLRRDGVTDKPPQRMGARAWVLWQLVAAAPLATWRRVDADPGKLLDRRVQDGLSELLRSAWSEAAARQRDVAWATALLERDPGDARRLIAVAPAAGERYLAARLDEGPALADALPVPWTREFTERVAAWIPTAPYPGRWLAALGRSGDPSFAHDERVRDASALLAFRRTMLDTLQEERPG